MSCAITEQQWAEYEEKGYLRLGHVLDSKGLIALQERIDDIMLGTADIDYSQILMQLDSSTGKYEDAGAMSNGFKHSTLSYRKIQNLEIDPLFLEYTQHPIFREICANVYGESTSIASFRCMFMNKPSNLGTWLPWHQDRWSDLDIDPLVTLWTALDPATKANGCVQVIEGSHKFGLLNPDHPSGFVTEEQAEHILKDHPVVYLEAEAGEALLLHNWLLHSSDVNRTSQSRRAFSVCYMEARTVDRSGSKYPVVF